MSYIDGSTVTWSDFKTYRNYAYGVCDGGACTEGLEIINLDNYTVTQSTAVFDRAHNIYIDTLHARLYVVGSNATNVQLTIYTLDTEIVDGITYNGTPANPVLLKKFQTTYIHDVYVRNNIAYASHGDNGYIMWDVTNPSNTQQLASNSDATGYNHSRWLTKAEKPVASPAETQDFQPNPAKTGEAPVQNLSGATKRQEQTETPNVNDLDEGIPPRQDRVATPKKVGVEAVSDVVLKVTLELPDKDFPKLVANPIFRPIYGDGADLETEPLNAKIVTNGAFSVAEVTKDGVTLLRSDKYWDKDAVKLDQAQFVQTASAETALEAYKKGEIHAVTNEILSLWL